MISRPISRIVVRGLTGLAALLSGANLLHALPPLGLTQITPATEAGLNLEIIDGAAYLTTATGIWTVDSVATTSFIEVTPSPTSITPVVKGTDGEIYVAANIGPINSSESTLYRFDQTLTPVVTWGPNALAMGIDSQLRMFDFYGARFLPDGSFDDYLESPIGSVIGPVSGVTPSGYVLGDAQIPNTIGSSPALWNPDGSFASFLFGVGFAGSIRDRADGNGVNVSDGDSGQVNLGSDGYSLADESGSPLPMGGTFVQVSQSDFLVGQIDDFGPNPDEFFGFFPGIVPGFDNRVVSLFDLFPILSTIDIDGISTIASVDGNFYMAITGSDGLYLFGAVDPSLVPEPATFALMMALVMPLALRRV
jgi:hypothetical protein